jgi:predicted DNA binding CopG/RHH family protein
VHVEIKSDSLEEIRKIYPRAYEKWAIKEDQQLTSEYEQDKSIPRLAITHQRKTEEIRSRLKETGLLSIKKITC